MLGKLKRSLEDAEECVRLRPEWSKGYVEVDDARRWSGNSQFLFSSGFSSSSFLLLASRFTWIRTEWTVAVVGSFSPPGGSCALFQPVWGFGSTDL